MANATPATPEKAPAPAPELEVSDPEFIKQVAPGIERRIPRSVPKANAAIRTIKMLQPSCHECQWPPRYRWWERCEHDPYFTDESEEIVTPNLEEDENGDFIVKGETIKIRVHRRPNMTQIPLVERIDSGRGVEHAKEDGCIMPSELGMPEMCQYYDCWEENPSFKTVYGNYCSANQARLIGADEEHVVVEVLEQGKRREQLRRIDISSS